MAPSPTMAAGDVGSKSGPDCSSTEFWERYQLPGNAVAAAKIKDGGKAGWGKKGGLAGEKERKKDRYGGIGLRERKKAGWHGRTERERRRD